MLPAVNNSTIIPGIGKKKWKKGKGVELELGMAGRQSLRQRASVELILDLFSAVPVFTCAGIIITPTNQLQPDTTNQWAVAMVVGVRL